jgi:hypothetical protein
MKLASHTATSLRHRVLRSLFWFERLYLSGGSSRFLADVDLGRNVSLIDNVTRSLRVVDHE